MRNTENPLTKAEQISAFNAIKNSDVDYIHQKIVNRDMANVHLDLSDVPDTPSVLKYYPPIISIAAYFSSKPVFDFLFMNNALITEVDNILSLFFNHVFYFKIKWNSYIFILIEL